MERWNAKWGLWFDLATARLAAVTLAKNALQASRALATLGIGPLEAECGML
jgi:hypothetical protein